MDTLLLEKKFAALGARVKIADTPRRWGTVPRPLTLDIAHDHRGEFFDLRVDQRQVERLETLDTRPRERHLLLMAQLRPFAGPVTFNRTRPWKSNRAILPPLSEDVEKPRYLCGHDERHWFVAAIPESAHASNVRTAMEALKPAEVQAAEANAKLRFSRRFTRKNRAFVRQGEWFFLPAPALVVPPTLTLHNEPMQRSGGKAHWAEFAYRRGGETVYVSPAFPSGLAEKAFRAHIARSPKDRGSFRIMKRNAQLFVRGRVSHPDHATVMLHL